MVAMSQSHMIRAIAQLIQGLPPIEAIGSMNFDQ